MLARLSRMPLQNQLLLLPIPHYDIALERQWREYHPGLYTHTIHKILWDPSSELARQGQECQKLTNLLVCEIKVDIPPVGDVSPLLNVNTHSMFVVFMAYTMRQRK